MTRHSGILLPLFSAASSSSWGIGELPDIGTCAAWLEEAGFDRLMLLPIGTMADGGASPYSPASAMAIDPIFIAVERLEEFARVGGVNALSDGARTELAFLRASTRVHHGAVRRVKGEALALAFESFVRDEWTTLSLRGAEFAAYIRRERAWLDDYALFKAIQAEYEGRPWTAWPAPLAARDEAALAETRRRLGREVLRQQYLQWIADTQWRAARAQAKRHGVAIFGDLPFMVELNSADVWVRPGEFWLDATVGAPPDPFSATGQDWGMPVYRWDVITAGGFDWMRARARRMAALYDGFRVDHIIGFYRTYARPKHGEPFFTPGDESTQIAQGETILRICLETGARVVAEDLGVLPHFLRHSLNQLGVAGYRVLRWEREWDTPGHPFIDPRAYPALTVAASGTHDTETMAEWWDGLPHDERFRLAGRVDAFNHAIRDQLLSIVCQSASTEMFLPIHDVFGWRERINTPSTVSDENWTWRLPWPVDQLADAPEAKSRAEFCRQLLAATRSTETP